MLMSRCIERYWQSIKAVIPSENNKDRPYFLAKILLFIQSVLSPHRYMQRCDQRTGKKEMMQARQHHGHLKKQRP